MASRDLVAHLVGVALGHRLRREQVLLGVDDAGHGSSARSGHRVWHAPHRGPAGDLDPQHPTHSPEVITGVDRAACALTISWMYAVILAGGGGTRLRPLSRADRPKPFLPLLDDRTLIQHTVDRLRPVPGLDRDLGRRRSRATPILVRRPGAECRASSSEPAGRNTAAAIALAALVIDRPSDEVMAVLPADHYSSDDERLRGCAR